jgi:hypothetical protein
MAAQKARRSMPISLCLSVCQASRQAGRPAGRPAGRAGRQAGRQAGQAGHRASAARQRFPPTHLLGLAILDNVKGVDARVDAHVMLWCEEAHVGLVEGAVGAQLQEGGEVVDLRCEEARVAVVVRGRRRDGD